MYSKRWQTPRTAILLFVTLTMLATTLILGSRAGADDNPATEFFTMACTVTPDLTPDTVVDAGVQGVVAGETSTFANEVVLQPGTVYQDILSRPDGSTYYASYLELVSLPSNLILDPASVVFTIDGNPVTVLSQATPDPTNFVLTSTTAGGLTTYQILFPGDEAQMLADQTGYGVPSYTVGGAAETFRLEFRRQMPAGATPFAPEDGAECFTSLSTGPSNRDTDRPRTAVSTVVPEMLIEKTTAPDNAYQAGSIVEFELIAAVPVVDSATLSHGVPAAQNAVLVDSPPAGLEPVDASGNVVPDGGTTAGGGIWDATARTITYAVGTVAPNTFWSTTEQFLIDVGAAPADVYENVACLSFTPLTDPTPVIDAGCDQADVVVASESPSIQKRAVRMSDEADLEQYGIGLPYWYDITVVVPGNSSYENFTILDTLPDGVIFNGYVSATCAPAGPTCPSPVPTLTETVFPGGAGTSLGWYPDTMPYDANPRTFTLRYEVELSPTYSSGDPLVYFDEFVNEASVNFNNVDRLGDVPPATAAPPTFDGSEDATDTVVYDRPLLVIDKSAVTTDGVEADDNRESWDYEIGDIATYTLVVENQGSSDAFDVTVLDIPAGITIDQTSVLVDGNPCTSCTFIGGTDLQVIIPGPLAPGAANAVTITYEAIPNQNGELDNVAAIPTYDDEFGTPYTENPSDEVGLLIPDPVLTLLKRAQSGVPETANTVGTLIPFTFTITNTSATTAYNAVVTDTPPSGTCVIAGGLDPAAAGTVTETAPGVYSIDNPIAPGATVTFDASIQICGDIDPGSYTNESTLTWTDLSDGVNEAGQAYVDDSDAPFTLVGPQFVVEKSPPVDGGALTKWSVDIDENGTLEESELNGGAWTITVTNTGTAPIGGLNVVDPMPDPFEYLPGTATVTWIPGTAADTFTDNSSSEAPGVLAAYGYVDTANFTIGQLQPGAEIRITVPFKHNGEDPSDGQLTRLNTVTVLNDNLPFDPVNHVAEGEYTLIPVEVGPSVSKTVTQAADTDTDTVVGVESIGGQPGQQFDFVIEVTLPTKATTQTNDIWILDELPDGMFLVNEPAVLAVPSSPATGWDVVCTSAACDPSGGGLYLGSQPGTSGKTELAWWFGDLPTDPAEADRTYLISFRAEVATTFADGTEIIDGFDEPIINVAMPVFNRGAGLPGASGDQVPEPPPAGVPNTADFERVYPLDPAEVDIQTPRIDVAKTITKDGVEVEEVTAGDVFTYEIVATNGGTGDAYDIVINDTLGTPSLWLGENFMQWDLGTLVTSPSGVTCTVYQPSPPAPVEHLSCTYPGPLAPGQSIVITYDATTVPNDEFYAQASTNNFDPMIIRNEANAEEYWEAAGQGGNQYTTGASTTRIFAYTPVAEIDATCVGGADVIPNAPVGSDVQFWAVFGNGDRIDINGNPGGDQTMTPFPTEDLDNDGFPDAGIGYNPEARITLQDTYVFNGVTGTGPGAGDPTYQTYTPFPAPDQILTPGDQGPGTYTLVWNTSLQDIPHSPNHATQGSYLPHNGGPAPTNGDFLPHYALLIDATKTAPGGATIWYELRLEDAAGNIDRGTTVGEPFTFIEKDRHGCPGGPPPQAWKYPDAEDGVTLAPGETDEFVIYIQQPDENPVPSTFTDLLPAGLMYRGDLPIGDPNYAVATMDVIPASWPSGATLQDYFTSSTMDASGNTTILWNPPPLDQGMFNDPNAGGADTRWVIRVPVIALDDPLFPNEFVTNKFEWNGDGTIRGDSGAMLTESKGKPAIDKNVDMSAGLYGDIFRYTIDITLPGGYAGSDVIVYDQINRYNNWDASPYNLQDGGNWHLHDFAFPYNGPGAWPPSVAGEINYANYAYTPAEFELSDYVSQTCLSGCGGADAINIVPLPPETLDTAGILPYSLANPEVLNNNGAIGWYLGDIEAAAQDRVIRLVYEVEAPTLLEQRQRVVDLNPTNWPLGATDPLFDQRDSRWFLALAQVNHPNLVQIRQFGGDNAVLGTWEGAGPDEWQTGSTAWHDEVSSSIVLNQADEVVTVSYPIVDMDKDCGAIGATSDPNVVTNPSVTPPGTPNMECTITLVNQSPVPAYDVNVNDTPLPDCVMAAVVYWGEYSYIGNLASGNPWWVDRSPSGTGFIDPTDPGVVTYPCDVQTLLAITGTGTVTDTGGDFPLDWDLVLGPNATETLTYQFYVDGWTDQPNATGLSVWNGSWEPQGMFINRATLSQWTAAPGSPDLIGEEVTVQDEAGFDRSHMDAQKFPYPVGRDICNNDASPFINWNKAPEASFTNLWPWRHHPAGDQYNPASAAHAAGFGDPLNSEYWTQGEDYCLDPLQPPDREVTVFSHPGSLRQIPLGTYHFSGVNGWSSWGDPWSDGSPWQASTGWGDGWFDRPLNDYRVWSDQFYARPTEPYRWAIDIRVDGLRHLSDIDITDTLPVGWEYVPGSATIVDGVWILGNHDGGTYDNDQGFETGYGEIPLPDPALANPPDGTPACHNDNNYHSGGQTMTWNFERDGGADGDFPWLYQYLDSTQRVSSLTTSTAFDYQGYDRGSIGWTDKASWVRIHYYATPLMEVLDCDPDTTSSDPFMMENNLRVTALRDNPIAGQGLTISSAFDALVPVTNPVNFEKLPDDQFVSDDTVAYFTIRFENNLSESIFDLPINDTLYQSLPSIDPANAGYKCNTATATIDGVPYTLFTEACTGEDTQIVDIDWVFQEIGPDQVLEITMPILVPDDEINTLRYDNQASTFVKEFYDSSFEDFGRITVVNPSPPQPVIKTVNPNPATINDTVTYEVSFTADPLQIFLDLAYIDTMPDGLTFVSHDGVTCTGGCPGGYSAADVITMTPQLNGDGSTTLMWWFGDMPGSNQPHTWTMTYTAVVDDTYNDGVTPVLDEDVLVNTVTGYSNHENLLDDPAGLLDPSSWDNSEFLTDPGFPTSEGLLDIEEPELSIAKSAVPLAPAPPVDGSAVIEFTVAITNTGGMDAYNISVTDTPNDALENIVMGTPADPSWYVTQGWTALVPEVGWFITELPRGETATFTYTAEVVDTFLVDGIWVAENIASLDEFWGRPGIEQDPDDRPYSGDEASAAVSLVAPEMKVEKSLNGCADDFAFVEIGEPVTWCLVVQNVGDAVAYNVTVSDELPYLWTYDVGSTTGAGEPGVVTAAGTDTVTWTLGNLAAGGSVTIEFDATPQQGSPEVITNWASVEMTDAFGADLPVTITQARDRDPASTSIGRYGLEIAKTPDEQQWPYIPVAGTVEWEIEVTNPATDTTNTDVIVTDFLPAPLTYVSSSSATADVSAAVVGAPGAGPGGSTQIEWTITDLDPLESVIIEIEAVNTGGETPMQWYVNDVQATSDQIPDLVANQAKVRFFEPASLGDYTWIDTNVDGIQDGGETGVNGVIVSLLDGNGDPLYHNPATGMIYSAAEWALLPPAQQAAAPLFQMTTQNDPATGNPGWYEFTDLPPGSYQVHFDPTPTGLFPTLDDQGVDDALDSDPNRFTGLSHVVTLVGGQHDPTIDMGLITPEQYDESLADLDIEKATNGADADDAPGPLLNPGDPVTWTYVVTNTGSTSLANVTVTDDVEGAANCDIDGDGTWDNTNVIPILRPGEVRNCFIQGTVGGAGGDVGPYENNADATGTPVLPDFDTCGCDPDDPTTWPTDPGDNPPATGTNGDPLPPEDDTDPSHYFSGTPSVDIEKATNGQDADTPQGPVVVLGDTVTWTYVVTNTGDTALANTTVSDSQGVTVVCDVDGNGIFDDATGPVIGLMLPDDEVTCQGTGSATVGPYMNMGSVTGDPVLPDPDTPGVDLDDPTTWPDNPDDYDPASDPSGDPIDPVEDEDPSHYLGAEPEIDIEKLTNLVQSDLPPGEPIDVGGAVTWTYVVTNEGDTALLNAKVVDSDPGLIIDCDPGPLTSDTIPLLLPNEQVSCTATGTATAGAYANTATVVGQPAFPTDPTIDPTDPDSWPSDPDDYTSTGTPPVDDEDDSHYYGVEGGLDIEKATNTIDADTAPGVALEPGDPVVWTYVVTNTSTLVMIDSVVTDSDIGAAIDCEGTGANVIAILMPGESATCTSIAPASAMAGQYMNDSDVEGTGSLPSDPDTDFSDPDSWPDNPDDYDPFVDDPFTDEDPSHYFALEGSLELEKATNGADSDNAPGEQILEGAPVTWTYAVTNNSNAVMIDVFVEDTDPTITVDCGGGSDRIPVLAIGETVACTATGTAELGQYMNDSNVSGTPAIEDPDNPGGPSDDPNSYVPSGHPPSTDEDPSHYFGSTPEIDIEKSTNGDDADTTVGPVLAPGDPVTWVYVVTNTGNVPLAPAVIVDNDPAVTIVCPVSGDNTIPVMLPEDVVTCSATGTAQLGAYENIAEVTGTPAELTDPTADPGDPDSYQPSGLDPVDDEDPSHYIAHDGDVMIVKTTNFADANEAPGIHIVAGEPVLWTYTVANTSNTVLVDLVVNDDQGEAVDCGDGTNQIEFLLPGATWVCTAEGTADTGQYSNIGDVVGTPGQPDGNGGYEPIPGAEDVTDDDPSNYFGNTPAIDIEKATNNFDADTTVGPILAPGDTVTWTYVVTNTGDAPLIGATVTDNDPAVTVDCADPATPELNTIALLLPTEQWTCTATGTAQLGQYENIADVTGTPAVLDDPLLDPNDPENYSETGQDDVVDDDPSHYIAHDGDVLIEKDTNGFDADTPTGPTIDVGDVVTWTYAVTNTSNTTLINLVVTDSEGETVDCGGSSNIINQLAPMATHYCYAAGVAIEGQYGNVGAVTGTPAMPDPTNGGFVPIPGAEEATDDDPSHYVGADPAIDIEKSTNGDDADNTSGPVLAPGDDVVWTYVVTNTGDVALIDVLVTDSQGEAVDCGNGDGSIALLIPGAQVTCVAEGTAVLGAYENIADVTGTPAQPENTPTGCCDPDDPDSWPTGGYVPTGQEDVVDDDPSHYVAHDAEIDIEKSTNGEDADVVPGPVVNPGEPVTWLYDITNPSTTPLINVVVGDDQGVIVTCPSGSNLIPLLLPGQRVVCEGEGEGIDGQYVNIGDVVGTPAAPNGNGGYDPIPGADPVDDDDPSHHLGAEPGIDIEKATNGEDADTVFGPILEPGDPVTWTFVVTNTGGMPLADVVVGDDDPTVTVDCGGPAGALNTIALLLPSEERTCFANGTAGLGTYRNIGDVSGTPVQPTDPPPGCCDPDDPTSWPTDPEGYEPTGQDPVDDTDPSHYVSSDGDIVIEKSTNGEDADTPTGPVITPGDPVVWVYAVINTSQTPLIDVTVNDNDPSVAVDCQDPSTAAANVIAVLMPGEQRDCFADGIAVAGAYTNIGSVVGQPAEENDDGGFDPLPGVDPVDDEDPSNYVGATPSIDVEKATNGEDADTGLGPIIAPGDPVNWTYVVTNDGQVPVTGVTVTDNDPAVVVDCADASTPESNTIALLLPEQSVTCTATGTASVGQYENIADVTGTPAQPSDPTDGCCDPENPGSWPNDPEAYEPTGQDDVNDDDPSHYVGAEGDIAIEKSTNGQDADVAPGVILNPGDPITWTYTIINPTDTPLVDMLVSDDQGVFVDCGDNTNVIALLLPGASTQCTATGTAVDGAYVNIGSVVGQPASEDPDNPGTYEPIPDADPVSDDDPSNHTGAVPAISVEKDTNGDDADDTQGPVLAPGDTVTWNYVVTNDGDVPVLNVEVEDNDPDVTVYCGVDNVIALLLPGTSITCTATGSAEVGAYENIATVSGTPAQPSDPTDGCCDPDDPTSWPTDPEAYEPTGQDPVGDDDPSHYVAVEPSVTIEKSTNGVDADEAPGPIVTPGDPVEWVYLITNDGQTPLIDLTVTDDQGEAVDCGDLGNTIALLLPGDEHICTANGVAADGAYTNVGSVTGTPAVEDPENPGTYEPVVGDDGEPIDPVGDDDPSNHLGLEPSINVEKDTNGDDADTTSGPVLAPGAAVLWTYVVSNDGEVPVSAVAVTDNDPSVTVACDDGSNVIGFLLPGESATCTATGTAVLGDYENIATVTGTPVQPIDPPDDCCDPSDPDSWPTDPEAYEPTGQDDVIDDDPSHYVAHDGDVMIQKSTNGVDADNAPGPIVAPGDPVVWTYVVTNLSTTPIVNLTVSDDQGEAVDCGDGGSSIAVLLPGETHECEADGVAGTGQYTNVGSVTGTPGQPDPSSPTGYGPIPGADPVGDDDPSNYIGATPAIAVEKATNGVDSDAAPGESILEGDDITWTYAVTNTGDMTVIDVVVADDQGEVVDCGDGTNRIAVLAPGATVTCTATGTAGEVAYTNNATVTGTPATEDPDQPGNWLPAPGADPVSDDDPSNYSGVPLVMDLALQKRLLSTTTSGSVSTHTFSIEVFNQGSVTASNIEIVDHMPDGMTLADSDWTDRGDGSASHTIAGPIAPGDSMMVEITTTTTAVGTYENIAGLTAATAHHPDSDEVLSLIDVDSQLGDTMSDPVVDDVLDNSGGDEDDSDIASVSVTRQTTTTTTTPTTSGPVAGPIPSGFGSTPTPARPSGPQASTNSPTNPLAYTGSEAAQLAQIGALMVLAGGGFVFIAKRRREDEEAELG